MLRTYGRQLTSARRLARFDRTMLLARAERPDPDARDARRQEMVRRVAREIVENLIVNGSDNPVVLDIKTTLEREVGQPLVFEYPLDGDDLHILRATPTGPQVLPPEQMGRLLGR
ncbi:MAG: DVU0524 family FlgM-associated protein, partial [Desulfovibrionaceae bacterium]